MDPAPPSNPPLSNPTPQIQRSWLSRNWKWFVPTGCLTLFLLVIGLFAVITVVVFSAMKSSDAYKMALGRAKSDPAVIKALGSPIEEGWYMTGKTNVEGPSGVADISIPISGPKGAGTIYAVATKSAGRWNYATLEVEVKATGERINLLRDEAEAEQ